MIGASKMKIQLCCMALICLVSAAHADDNPPQNVTVKFRVTGLFCAEREKDLRDAASKLTDLSITNIDFEKSEITFSYDASKILKNAKPEQVQSHIDNALRNATNHTFGIKPLSTIPADKLKRVEISVEVLDCKACGFGLYNMVSGVAGVEQTLVEYKKGKVIAWIDPEKTDRDKIVALLKQREVQVKPN